MKRKIMAVLIAVAMLAGMGTLANTAQALENDSAAAGEMIGDDVPVVSEEDPSVSEEAPSVSEEDSSVSEESPSVSEEDPSVSEEPTTSTGDSTSPNTGDPSMLLTGAFALMGSVGVVAARKRRK